MATFKLKPEFGPDGGALLWELSAKLELAVQRKISDGIVR